MPRPNKVKMNARIFRIALLSLLTSLSGLVFAQDYLEGARRDLKVYAIGEQIFGVRKAFSPESFLHGGESMPLSNEIIDIARRTGVIFGLKLFGLDIAEDESGPRVVDVDVALEVRAAQEGGELLLRAAGANCACGCFPA